MPTLKLSFVLFLFAACATPGAVPTAEFAPTPYTAEQIRLATKVGRTYDWRVEMPGKPVAHRVITFTRVAEADLDTTSTMVSDDGATQLAPPKVTHATWEELRKHAEFPKSAVVIDEEKITVPAGSSDCLTYTVTEGSGSEAEVTRFYFAKDMPGAPVMFTTDKGGVRVMTSTLVRYSDGAAKP